MNMQRAVIESGADETDDPGPPEKGTFQCQWCLNPFEREPRQSPDLYQMRAILMIPDCPDPIICDTCLNTVLTSFNPRFTVPGTSNSGPDNLVLSWAIKD